MLWPAMLTMLGVVGAVQQWEEEPGYKEVNPGGAVVMVCMVKNKLGECRLLFIFFSFFSSFSPQWNVDNFYIWVHELRCDPHEFTFPQMGERQHPNRSLPWQVRVGRGSNTGGLQFEDSQCQL